MRYFLELSYSGKSYNGWQVQPGVPSVQQTLQQALTTLLRRQTVVVGAGRTDTGVHASFYVAHFDAPEAISDREAFRYHLNALLPWDIAVSAVRPVREDAHARFDATEREYRYYVSLRKDPFRYDTAMYLTLPPDVERMNRAAEQLLSTSDFTSFSKLHSNNRTNICRVTRAQWASPGDGMLVFTIAADRFLRNMVRAVVGTLLDVGRGKLDAEGFRAVIDGRDRCLAGGSVPPQGLFLSGITYPEEIYAE